MAHSMAKRKSQFCRHNSQALGKTDAQQEPENLLHMTSHSCEENLMGTLKKPILTCPGDTHQEMLGISREANSNAMKTHCHVSISVVSSGRQEIYLINIGC